MAKEPGSHQHITRLQWFLLFNQCNCKPWCRHWDNLSEHTQFPVTRFPGVFPCIQLGHLSHPGEKNLEAWADLTSKGFDLVQKNPGNAKWSATSSDLGAQKDSTPYLLTPLIPTIHCYCTQCPADVAGPASLGEVHSVLKPCWKDTVSEQKTWRWRGLSTVPSSDICCAPEAPSSVWPRALCRHQCLPGMSLSHHPGILHR